MSAVSLNKPRKSIRSLFGGRYGRLLSIPPVILLLAVVTPAIANAYWLSALTSAVALSLAASGVAILYGQLGLVSLCQYALVGVGGWVALRLGVGFGVPFEIGMLAAGVAASAVGVLFGLPALRLKGLYLALVTLMLAGAYQVLISAVGFPDGGAGFFGRAEAVARRMLQRPMIATSAPAYFIYALVVAGLGFMLAETHRVTKPGRSWALIRKGETIALAAGVNLLAYKAWAFALAGFLAGVAGALLAGGVGQLDGRAFAASESLNLFALAIVGGVYHWFGALIAGALLRAVPALLTDIGVDGFVSIGIFGAALLHALITAPRGVAGNIAASIRRWMRPVSADA